MVADDSGARILNLRVTHKRASLAALEAFSFAEPCGAAREIRSISGVGEAFVLQTCNRVEIYAVVRDAHPSALMGEISEFWTRRNGIAEGDFGKLIEGESGTEALLHLLRVAAGLESMVIGEDQILGQLRGAYLAEKRSGTVGPTLDRILRYALRVGKGVRSSTTINRGAVSIGSVAVELLGSTLRDLGDKKILILGAGEAGEMVGRALASRKAGLVFVANRTHSRAVETATALGAAAIHFGELEGFMASADAVAVATSAPHFVLTLPLMSRVVCRRMGRRLVVLDLSEPRNVDRAIAKLPGVTLLDLDDLHELSRASLEMRAREAREADKIVQRSLGTLTRMLKLARVEPLISALCQKAEQVRQTEVRKAFARLRSEVDRRTPGGDPVRDDIIEDLSKSLTDALLYDQITNLRKSGTGSEAGDLLVAEEILGIPRLLQSGWAELSPGPRGGGRRPVLGSKP